MKGYSLSSLYSWPSQTNYNDHSLENCVSIKHKRFTSGIIDNYRRQYFAGLSSYKDEQPFAPSLFVEIRKRMGQEVFSSFEQIILEKMGHFIMDYESQRRARTLKDALYEIVHRHKNLSIEAITEQLSLLLIFILLCLT